MFVRLIFLVSLLTFTLCSSFRGPQAHRSCSLIRMVSSQVASRSPVSVVTGASRGIGRAVALSLAEAGCTVVVNYSSNEDAAKSVVDEINSIGKGGSAIAIKANCASFEEVESMFKVVKEKFGGVDVLINNAGITRDMLAIMMKPSDFSDVVSLNLNGVFYCSQQAFATSMMRSKKGRIVNVASIVGQIGNAGQANYAAAKAGVLGITKTLAKEFGSRGVTVNAVCPGFIDTDMTKDINKESLLPLIPLRRFGTTAEVAGMIRFLALDPSAAYITGHSFNVDGGLAIGAT